MRLSVVLLVVSLLGVVGGAWLIGTWAVGLAVIFDSLCVGVYALGRDDGRGEPVVVTGMPQKLYEAIERARAS